MWTVILCLSSAAQVKEEAGLDLQRHNWSGIVSAPCKKFPSAANLSVHTVNSTQLKCSSSLPVGLRWHLWVPFQSWWHQQGTHPRCTTAAVKNMLQAPHTGTRPPWQATDSGWNTTSNSNLLAFQLFQKYNYLPSTKAVLIHTSQLIQAVWVILKTV